MDCRYKVNSALIARRVKTARRAAGLTQEQLAEKIDISANAVAKLENNLMSASLQTLANIANVLRVNMDYFLCEDGEEDAAAGRDAVICDLLRELSSEEKDFLIHVINGMRLYHP